MALISGFGFEVSALNLRICESRATDEGEESGLNHPSPRPSLCPVLSPNTYIFGFRAYRVWGSGFRVV